MADRCAYFNSFQCIHVIFNKRIDISISIRPMITKFSKQVHLQDLLQVRLIKQVLVTLLSQDHMMN